MSKVIVWILANGATMLGTIQAVLKVLKELLTGVVNLLSIFMPVETAQNVVMSVRNFINVIDGWVEKIKAFLVPQV